MTATGLRLVRENELPNPSDSDIERVDAIVAKQAEQEAFLWGGPRGEGVIPGLKHLGETVTQLAATVATLAGRVTGEDGVVVQLRDLKAEIKAMTLAHAIELEDARREREELEKKNQKRNDRVWQVIGWVGFPSVIAAVFQVIRQIYVIQHGISIAH